MNIKIPYCRPIGQGDEWGDIEVSYEYGGMVDISDGDELLLRIDPAQLKQIVDAIWWENEVGWQRQMKEDLSEE